MEEELDQSAMTQGKASVLIGCIVCALHMRAYTAALEVITATLITSPQLSPVKSLDWIL